jgi:transposase
MYTVIDKEYIRKKHFVEGWSIRRISKELKIARQTARKMLEDGEIPKYNLSQARPSPVMDPFREVILNILKEDEKAPIKQRHNAVRIYERLRDEYGFTGGASTARRYVSKLKKTPAECFLMLEANAGEQIQVDFGHAQVDMNGKRISIHLFCMRLKYSSVPFVVALSNRKVRGIP